MKSFENNLAAVAVIEFVKSLLQLKSYLKRYRTNYHKQ